MDAITDEKIALAYTHLIYRNTELEDYHSENVKMDMAFYDIIHRIVNEKIGYIKASRAQMAEVRSSKALRKLIMDGDSNPIGALVSELSFHGMMGTDWDPPQMSEDTAINNKDLAGYVLKGHFLEYCEKNVHLDDPAMCYINKDVYNRVYTLVMLGQL